MFQEKHCLFVKGALVNVMKMCDSKLAEDGQHVPLDEIGRAEMEEAARSLGSSGLRVLAMARGETMETLSLVGLVGMIDPPREKAKEAIDTVVLFLGPKLKVRSAGVKVKMITGDAAETAQAIGTRLGLFQSGDTSLSGQQLDEISDEDLQKIIRQVVVFYRTTPRHKLKIVKVERGGR